MFTPTLRCECAQPASDRLMRKWCIGTLVNSSLDRPLLIKRVVLVKTKIKFYEGAQPVPCQGPGGGRKRLPKFKFSAKFPIGLHVILQIQIRKFENDCHIM